LHDSVRAPGKTRYVATRAHAPPRKPTRGVRKRVSARRAEPSAQTAPPRRNRAQFPKRTYPTRSPRVAQPAGLRPARRTKASVGPEGRTERSNSHQPAGLRPARRTKASVGPEGRTERSNSSAPRGVRKRVSARRAEPSAQMARHPPGRGVTEGTIARRSRGSARRAPPGAAYESECRPGGPNGALKQLRPARRTNASVGPEGRTERSKNNKHTTRRGA